MSAPKGETVSTCGYVCPCGRHPIPGRHAGPGPSKNDCPGFATTQIRIPPMRLSAALLSSLCLHAVFIFGPAWFAARPPPAPQPKIEVRLQMPQEALTMAESVSTNPTTPPAPQIAPSTPHARKGVPLRQAQAALTPHLFYPPDAVARGQEGEVILLLSMTDSGQLSSVEIARSSGHALLDQAALDAARQIGSLPGSKRQLLFPVSFRLQ